MIRQYNKTIKTKISGQELSVEDSKSSYSKYRFDILKFSFEDNTSK